MSRLFYSVHTCMLVIRLISGKKALIKIDGPGQVRSLNGNGFIWTDMLRLYESNFIIWGEINLGVYSIAYFVKQNWVALTDGNIFILIWS